MNSMAIKLDKGFTDYIRKENSVSEQQPIRAVAYARVSTEMQPQSAIESQLAVIDEFAELNDIEIAESFSDRGKSGTTDKRPSFQKMVKFVQENNIQMVIAFKLDRIFRNEALHHHYEFMLNQKGIHIISATEEIYKNDLGTRLYKDFLLIHNESEAEKIRQNVRRGQTYTAKQAKTNGGIAPLGYDIDSEGKYIINEEEAEIVKKIFQMRHNGLTYEEMAKELNKHHYKTKVGKNFTKNSFSEILVNPKYKGDFVYNKSATATEYGKRPNRHSYKDESEQIKVEGGIEAIVSKQLWDSVQPKKKTGVKKNKGKYLLSGLVKCPVCGGVYEADKRNDVTYFRHKQPRKADCVNSIRMDEVEKKTVKKVVSVIYSKDNTEYFCANFDYIASSQTAKIKKEMSKLKQRIIANERKKGKLIDFVGMLDNKSRINDVKNKIQETDTVIEDLTQELNQLNSKIPQKPSLEDVKASRKKLRQQLLKHENMPVARKLIKRIIESVNVKEDNIEIILK